LGAPPVSPAIARRMNAIETYLRQASLSVWDVVDILIVAVALYEFMKLIRGTRAVQMAVGSALIALFFFASRWAPLQTVNWLIRNIFGYVVFAAIVIFQSDIRRALAHFGRAPFFRYFSRMDDAEETIEELVVAANMLSDRRTGAIMVVERAIGLRNYIESGIPLEATVTHDLLVSIFQVTSPLHDGAVILQENRVAAAACFLPLTVNPQLSRELGTRHRAAIGLTEETDALAIVVSEETGKISLALEGHIERGLTPDLLRARLRALISEGRQAPVRPRVRGTLAV
jgi:diadenylate cyclase